MSDLQVPRTKMWHLCLESHEQPGRLNLPRLPAAPIIREGGVDITLRIFLDPSDSQAIIVSQEFTSLKFEIAS